MDVNETYCGDHVTKYTDVKSLCGTPKMSIISQFKKKTTLLSPSYLQLNHLVVLS